MTLPNYCGLKRPLQNKTGYKTFFSLLLTIGLWQTQGIGQDLFTYKNKKVSAAEFLAAFDKNPTPGDRKKAMEDYLPLYINYRLKLQEAKYKKLDTLFALRQEEESYRLQLQENALSAKTNLEKLVTEALKRAEKDVEISYLKLNFKAGDTASENRTKVAVQQAQTQLRNGKSADEVLKNLQSVGGASANYLGFITVFALPYRFENAVYDLPAGQYSPVLKGKDGWYILKKHSERPSPGKYKVAQILKLVKQGASEAEVSATRRLADSIYQLAKSGINFQRLVAEHSDDRTSVAVGGELAPVTVGEYERSFNDAVFGLKKEGDITGPVQSSFGFHIIKLLGKLPAVSADVNEAQDWARQKITNGDRQSIAQKEMIRSNFKNWNYKAWPVNLANLWRFTDSTLANKPAKGLGIAPTDPLFSFGNEITHVENWILYLRAFVSPGQKVDLPTIWDHYLLITAENYYRNNLFKLEPHYANLLREFSDANLVFENADRTIWSAASNNPEAVKQHYEKNRNHYKWLEGAQAIMAVAEDSALLVTIRKTLVEKPTEWRQLKQQYAEKLYLDSTRYEWEQMAPEKQVEKPLAEQAGSITKNPFDNSYSFIYVFKRMPGGDQKSYEEAKGWALSDYQKQLEENWVKRLRQKYPVVVNQKVWQSLVAKAGNKN